MPDERLVRLSILESYGVRWTAATFARDLLQNFFDATPEFRSIALEVDRPGRTVEIRGPVEFDLELLAYIGATTKKDGRTAGRFGEGLKICALAGTRDLGLTMTAGSGADELTVCFEPVPLGRSARRTGGSWVRLERCKEACLAVFEEAPAISGIPTTRACATSWGRGRRGRRRRLPLSVKRVAEYDGRDEAPRVDLPRFHGQRSYACHLLQILAHELGPVNAP